MRNKKSDIGAEVIADLKEMHSVLKAGIPLREKYAVRKVRVVPGPGKYNAADVQATRVGGREPTDFRRNARRLARAGSLVRVRSAQAGPHRPAIAGPDPCQSVGVAENSGSRVRMGLTKMRAKL